MIAHIDSGHRPEIQREKKVKSILSLTRISILPLLLFTLVIGGCDSNDVDDEETTMVTLRLQPVVNGEQLTASESKTYDINGATVSFSSARLYLSQIVLHAEDGSDVTFEADPVTVPAKDADDNTVTHTVTDMIVLAKHDLGDEDYDLGEVPAKRYTSVSFKVGIEGIDNRVDASQVPAGHPLAKQTDKNNHWNWSAGYQYIRMDGMVDTDGDGAGDTVWETHLGTENLLREVTLSGNEFTLNAGDHVDLHVMVNYGNLLSDVDLTDPEQQLCHTADNLPVAGKVGDKIASSFMLHGVHTHE